MAYLEVRDLRKSYVTPRGTTDVLGGIDLTLETAARKVRLMEASPAPRAELLCAGPLAPRAAVAA